VEEVGGAQSLIPDFVIVGAPKCGTTAMDRYLSEHPGVFMAPKEVHYFGSDRVVTDRRLYDEASYLELFRDAPTGALLGESSVWYLYSRLAAAEIKAFAPGAKIIVMLRNPVEMLYSLHSQSIYNGNEDIVDFAAALAAEPERRAGRRIPRSAHFPAGLHYLETAQFSEQVERYFDVFGRDRVHVIIYDDLKRDPARQYASTLSFLGLDNDGRTDFRVVNANKTVRSRRALRVVRRPPAVVKRVGRIVLPSRRARQTVWGRLGRGLVGSAPRPPMSQEVRRRLEEELRPEVSRLSALLDRDLSAWVSVRERACGTPQ
jgi:hypothetical protein